MTETFRQALLGQIRDAAGMSIAGLAERTLISQSHLYNVLNGHRPATLEVVQACDDALYAGGLLVDLYAAETEGDDVRRRAVLGALGAVAGLGAADPAAVVAESLRVSLLSAYAGDDWPEVAVEYGRRFMTDPVAAFRRSLTGDLMVLRQQITTGDSQSVRLVAPRLMTLAGMAVGNTGDVLGAARWYRSARLAADRTDDDELKQWTRGREAFRRGYEGAAPTEVLAVGTNVDDVEARLATAQAYARLGERSQARRALTAAQRAHEHTDQSETTIYAMPPWRWRLSAGYVWALLGDVNQADTLLSEVTPPPAVRRWEAQRDMERAVAHTRAGDTHTGAELAREIMHALPDEQRSVVLIEMAREARAGA